CNVHHTEYLDPPVNAPHMDSTTVELGDFADEDGDGFGDAGETMNYAITIQNTGNVRLGTIFVA
ncbi:unnamed protein product, partial [Sphacelaria rigidula]